MSVTTVSTFLAVGTIALGAGVLATAFLWLTTRFSNGAANAVERLSSSVRGYGLWIAWVMAVVATLGSLYYSEIAGFTPCDYCWYQRIAMYPLAIVLGIAAFRRDHAVRRYVLPLAVVGGLISSYHYTIQHFPSFDVGSCNVFAPCSAAWVWMFDFVSIPLMALVSFGVIVTALALDRPGLSALDSELAIVQGSLPQEEDA
jgi:disulfide bond formation protein DsbB